MESKRIWMITSLIVWGGVAGKPGAHSLALTPGKFAGGRLTKMMRSQVAFAASNAACTGPDSAGPTFWMVRWNVAAAPVAVNVIGVATPGTVAVIVLLPGAAPTVQLATCATPLLLVAIVAGPLIEPPPPVTANVTMTP